MNFRRLTTERPTFLPLFVFCLMVSLTGCVTSRNSLVIDASRPVYFGNMAKTLSSNSAGSPEFVESIVASSAHVSEKERTYTGEHFTLYVGGTEETRGNVVYHMERAFQGEADRFIGDGIVNAKIEAYIPWYSFAWDLLASMIFGKTESSGPGDVTQETLEFEGKIYRLTKTTP